MGLEARKLTSQELTPQESAFRIDESHHDDAVSNEKHVEALQVVEINKRLEEIAKTLEELPENDLARGSLYGEASRLKHEKEELIAAYRFDNGIPQNKTKSETKNLKTAEQNALQEKLNDILGRLSTLEASGSGTSPEAAILRDKYDTLLAGYTSNSERVNSFDKPEKEKNRAPRSAVGSTQNGTASVNLRAARARIGHAPLRSQEQIAADRQKKLQQLRAEYGYEGLHVTKPAAPEEVRTDDIPIVDDVVSREGALSVAHEALRQEHLAVAEADVYQKNKKPEGFFRRIWRSIRGR